MNRRDAPRAEEVGSEATARGCPGAAPRGRCCFRPVRLRRHVDSLRRTLSSDTTVEDRGVRFAHFDLRHPPYKIEAAVTMPPPPDSARIDLGITLDPIHLAARVTCTAPNSEGVRTASIAASSPSWAVVRFDRVEQSPDLCARVRHAPRRQTREFSFPLSFLAWAISGACKHLDSGGFLSAPR
jgi:hypothetical protein